MARCMLEEEVHDFVEARLRELQGALDVVAGALMQQVPQPVQDGWRQALLAIGRGQRSVHPRVSMEAFCAGSC